MVLPRFYSSVPMLALLACAMISSGGAAERPLMRELIGINGHTVQFKPALYAPVCRVVRDYHPVAWDLEKETAKLPAWPFAKNRVDWSKVYGSWREKEFTIDACLMFESIKRPQWADIEGNAREYGRTFAAEFGPSGARKLVESVEIGNEPGEWSDEDYTIMFRAMAEGVRAGDPKLKIATCNLTTGKSGKYEKSVACIAKFPQLVDVLNIHSYAQLENWPTWRRSFPEDPKLPKYLQDLNDLVRWRDANMPGKPIWLTEFGYDSSTKTPDKDGDPNAAKWVGVTDTQQAQWLVRSLLVFSAMQIDRACIYFFNDDDKPSLHASAGITRHFEPKPSYHALAQMQRTLGAFRFERIVTNEPGKLRVQEYRDASNLVAWIAWSPTGEGSSFKTTLAGAPGKLISAQGMVLTANAEPPAEDATQAADGSVTATIGESPLYLVFERK